MAHRAKQNHHPTREKRSWKWQKASASIVVEKSGIFSIFNIFYVFIFLFPLIVFGFSGELKVSQFYCFCFNAPNARVQM